MFMSNTNGKTHIIITGIFQPVIIDNREQKWHRLQKICYQKKATVITVNYIHMYICSDYYAQVMMFSRLGFK